MRRKYVSKHRRLTNVYWFSMRAIEKKRPPLMNRRRWITLIIVLIILLIVGTTLFYRSIHRELWQEKSEAEQIIEQSEAYNLETLESLNKYVWENPYWILLAETTDTATKTYSVWSGDQQIAKLAYADAVSQEDMQAIVQSSKANAESIRLQVGYAFGQLVWEVKYKDSETTHSKIAFYSLASGSFIDEYTIPKEARP